MLPILMGCPATDSDCEPQTIAELCERESMQCGETTVVDRCDGLREIDCGQCPCQGENCSCEIEETDAELCQRHEMECGEAMVLDGCETRRTIDCGDCACQGETSPELCARDEIECGEATVVDRCDNSREIDCGECPCEGEAASELCAQDGLECGEATVTDRCGATRSIDCGTCAGPGQCMDNGCDCMAESDEILCESLGAFCGSLSAEDRCGESRSLHCGECETFEATLGAVRDARTGDYLGEATLRIHAWPPQPGRDGGWAWPVDFRADRPDFSATTASEDRGGINYEFIDGFGTCEEGRIDARLSPDGWYRIRIDLPGYAPGIFYRFHWGYDADCTVRDCDGLGHPGQCHSEDFELWPLDEPYPLYPDLFVDPRDLSDQEWQCAIMPPNAPHRHLIGLRHTVGATNIGMGPLHLRGVDQDGNVSDTVYQRIEWSDGRLDERATPDGAFRHDHGHEHIHFQAFVDMYIVHARRECANPFHRPNHCVSVQENRKVSWCLMDDSHFDQEILSTFNGEQSYIYPSVCENFVQGITQGWKDYYDKDLPGQVVVLGPPEEVDGMGPRWLEVMIDPQDFLFESTRANNVSRILIEAPAPTSNICQSSAALDCSGPPSQFNSQQRRHCRAYLDFSN
ncbi:MAG: hypothetical protein ACNA8W_01335 [Bradymonadaceae bacterium]